jgi:hypothetical protein
MGEYWPFAVIFVFAVLLYFGTILWTEVLFPDADDKYTVVSDPAAQPGLFDKLKDEPKTRKPEPEFARR